MLPHNIYAHPEIIRGDLVSESKRIWAQAVLLTLLGLLWLVRGLINNEFAIITIGLSLIFGAVSFSLTSYVISDSRVKRYTEIAFLAASLGIIILGYILSGSPILMIFTALIIAFLILGFILSYFLPKIRGKNDGKMSFSCRFYSAVPDIIYLRASLSNYWIMCHYNERLPIPSIQLFYEVHQRKCRLRI